jgi:hypothetical protein
MSVARLKNPVARSEASFSRLDHDVGASHRGSRSSNALHMDKSTQGRAVVRAYRPGPEQGLAEWRPSNPLLMMFDFRRDISR